MDHLKLILLPFEGRPVKQVWLPPSRKLADLEVKQGPSRATNYEIRKRCEALRLPGNAGRPLMPLHDHGLLVWVAQVPPDVAPRGLRAVGVAALNDEVLRRIIAQINDDFAQSQHGRR